MSNGIPHFEKFLSDLLNSFIEDQRVVDLVNKTLSGILHDLKTKAIQGVDQYVTKQLIPELSRLIQSVTRVSVELQLMLLMPFITRGLATFLEQGRILDKNEIIQMAKKSFPELLITTVIPYASEHTKTLLRNALNLVQEAVFAPRPGTTPSLKTLLKTLYEKCADKVFCIDKEKLGQVIDKLIEVMPYAVDGIMEFLVRHVLPALSGCFEGVVFPLVAVFLSQSFEKLRKGERVRRRDLAKPLATKVLESASTQVAKNTAEEGSKVSTTVVKEAATKSKVADELVKKYVIRKAVNSMSDKTIKSIGGEATQQVAGSITIQKASHASNGEYWRRHKQRSHQRDQRVS